MHTLIVDLLRVAAVYGPSKLPNLRFRCHPELRHNAVAANAVAYFAAQPGVWQERLGFSFELLASTPMLRLLASRDLTDAQMPLVDMLREVPILYG